MKKLALAIAVSAAAVSAQAAVTTNFSGTLDTFDAGSAYASGTYDPVQALGYSDVDY